MLCKEDLGTKFEIKIPALALYVDLGSASSDHCHDNEMLGVLRTPLCDDSNSSLEKDLMSKTPGKSSGKIVS